jgi:hypothetical protein
LFLNHDCFFYSPDGQQKTLRVCTLLISFSFATLMSVFVCL